MTYYTTDKATGEMTPLLEPLRHKPRGKVHRLPSPHIRTRQTTYYPRRRYRRPVPMNDLLSGLAACVVALAVLTALSK